jgi:hypothetical protein
MKSKKTMIICLVAVLALAMMGFGFAKWSDSVKFEGSVETGNIGVNIQGNGTNDQGADPQKFPGNNKEGKDVASCDLTTTCDEKTVKLKINNAYPWYAPQFSFRINGTGTVPVKLETVKYDSWSGQLGKFIVLDSWEIHVVNPASHGLDAVDKTVKSTSRGYKATWESLTGALKKIQLHDGGYIDVTVGMYIKETIRGGGCDAVEGETEYEIDGYGPGPGPGHGGGQIAPQNANSECTLKFDFAQWNEVEGKPSWIR